MLFILLDIARIKRGEFNTTCDNILLVQLFELIPDSDFEFKRDFD